MEQTVSKDQLRRERSWILYDCGNSAYSMAITTALFPVLFGMFSGNAMILGYFNSLASIIVAILSPILGTIADYKDKKKRFFFFFFLMGVLMTAALAFVPYGQWQALAAIYILSGVGFSGANIFYDSFLTDVTTDERMDLVSAKGFAYGYIASILPFGISLGIIYFMGMDIALGYQIGFIITALWWALFTVPMLRDVKQNFYVDPVPRPIVSSFSRLANTFREIRKLKYVFLFLIAYFFYIDGVDTIIKMVVPYATSVLGELDMFILLGILLIIQIVAFPCALLFGHLAKRFGNLFMIRIAILIYIITVFFAYGMSTLTHVFILGGMVALAQGGIQALSRSYFARIIPKEKSNEFFGFYNIFGKFAAILGPAIMSFIEGATGVARYSILGILPLFIAGFILTLLLPKQTERVVLDAE